MPDKPLTPASPEDLEQALAHALQYNGRRHFKTSQTLAAKITAAHLADCLRKSGFVVMKTPTPPLPLAKDCAYANSARRVMDEVEALADHPGPAQEAT